MNPAALRAYGQLCGWVLARAHACTGNRLAIAAYLGDDDGFDRALVKFGERYADRTEADHSRLGHAVRVGLIHAQTGL
jgi:hypothetical protein